jgi:predicted nucleotidyltransferase
LKIAPFEAAQKFIESEFPNCLGAILSGSVTRGEHNETSDLDIIVIENSSNAYRESVIKFDWMIEVFVYDVISYKPFFESDQKRARPTLIRMIAEGVILKHHPEIDRIKQESKLLLLSGPNEWDENTTKRNQYFLTDVLNDFIGCENRLELLCITGTLLERLHEFILRTNKRWIGSSKWIYRELKQFDQVLASEIFSAFNQFYETGEKKQVIELVDLILKPYGGRLFNGFTIGK